MGMDPDTKDARWLCAYEMLKFVGLSDWTCISAVPEGQEWWLARGTRGVLNVGSGRPSILPSVEAELKW